jgi:hypothetical protein
VLDCLSERERERLPTFLSVSTKFYITSASIPIVRTMSQSKQTSPAPTTPNWEEAAAGMDFSSVEAFRASLAGYYGMFLFCWHSRMLLTAEPPRCR